MPFLVIVAAVACLQYLLNVRRKCLLMDRARVAYDEYWALYDKIEEVVLSPRIPLKEAVLRDLLGPARFADERHREHNKLSGLRVAFTSLESVILRALDGQTRIKTLS